MATKVLIISHDIVAQQMAGPGIRYFNLARVLNNEFDTTLAAPKVDKLQWLSPEFKIIQYVRGKWETLREAINAADVILLPSDVAGDFPQLGGVDAPLVIDGYDPLMAEWFPLHSYLETTTQFDHWHARMIHLQHQYLMGDFFICASERQRNWWLGLLESNGRINPYTYKADKSFYKLIDVVPYGLPSTTPVHTRDVVKGVWQGISKSDIVILWGGGLWTWLDPLTAIRAINLVREQHKNVRLIFPGTKHPNPRMSDTLTHVKQAKQLAKDLGLLDKTVFFGDWVQYQDWQNVLLESDLALSLHFDTLETQLAFRSRVLEYIWANLPTITTKGDATSDLIQQYGIGVTVDFEDEQMVADAVLSFLNKRDGVLDDKFQKAKINLTWENVAKPLIEFCRNPQKSPDKIAIKNIGNPFYQHQLDTVQKLLHGYQQGRFIRFMQFIKQIQRKTGLL